MVSAIFVMLLGAGSFGKFGLFGNFGRYWDIFAGFVFAWVLSV